MTDQLLYTLAVLWMTSAIQSQQSPPLELVLNPVKDAYLVGEPISVLVRVQNGGRDRPLVILPQMEWARQPSTGPELNLSIEVFDEKGTRMEPSERGPEPVVKRVLPGPCSFLQLFPDAFYGELVVLTGPGGYALNTGRYTVRAEVSSSARGWVEGRRKRFNELPFAVDDVFQGTVKAAPMTLDIRSPHP